MLATESRPSRLGGTFCERLCIGFQGAAFPGFPEWRLMAGDLFVCGRQGMWGRIFSAAALLGAAREREIVRRGICLGV